MARKNLLAGLLEGTESDTSELPRQGVTGVTDALQVLETSASAKNPSAGSTAKGPVGAVSRSLERLTAEVHAARQIGDQLASGTVAVEIDPGLVDGSPVADRLSSGGLVEEATLIAAIRDHGQQIPILVRPHPSLPGRYQTAYGHRRLRAAAALGRPVRAFVKDLTDDELVVAQGQENSARQDLTFIERASFAAVLEDRGHHRDVIKAALSVDRTELSRLLAVRRTVPDAVVHAIGPAPKAGRKRWMALAQRLAQVGAQAHVQLVLADVGFAKLSSDHRFVKVLRALLEHDPPPRENWSEWTNRDGARVARIERDAATVRIAIDDRIAPAFGDYIVARLGELYDAHRSTIPRRHGSGRHVDPREGATRQLQE